MSEKILVNKKFVQVATEFRDNFFKNKKWEKFFTVVYNLKYRWVDEREYEDFKEYINFIKNELPKDLKYRALTKTFKLTVNYKGFIVNLNFKNNGLTYKGCGYIGK